jgi:general secretion pathway protein G
MKKVVMMSRKGFTLIEVIVVAAIIAILAGILVPMIFSQIDESKKARAAGDIKGIHTAIIAFQGSTKKNPVYFDVTDCTKIASMLYSAGNPIEATALIPWVPGADDYKFKERLNIEAATSPATTCYSNTSPINLITENPADPWGNRYTANTSDLATPGAPVWIISAGPNGVLDTDSNSNKLNNNPKSGVADSGDDIGIRWQ